MDDQRLAQIRQKYLNCSELYQAGQLSEVEYEKARFAYAHVGGLGFGEWCKCRGLSVDATNVLYKYLRSRHYGDTAWDWEDALTRSGLWESVEGKL